MKNKEEIEKVKEKLERFRKEENKKFGGSDYPRLVGWISALSWVLSDEDYVEHIKKKFDPKVVKLLSEFQ